MLLNVDIQKAIYETRKNLTALEFNVMECNDQYLEIYLANELTTLAKKTSNLTTQLGG